MSSIPHLQAAFLQRDKLSRFKVLRLVHLSISPFADLFNLLVGIHVLVGPLRPLLELRIGAGLDKAFECS